MRRTRNLLSSSHLFNPFSTLHPAPGKPFGSRDPTAKWAKWVHRSGWFFAGAPRLLSASESLKHRKWIKKIPRRNIWVEKIWHGCKYISVTKKELIMPKFVHVDWLFFVFSIFPPMVVFCREAGQRLQSWDTTTKYHGIYAKYQNINVHIIYQNYLWTFSHQCQLQLHMIYIVDMLIGIVWRFLSSNLPQLHSSTALSQRGWWLGHQSRPNKNTGVWCSPWSGVVVTMPSTKQFFNQMKKVRAPFWLFPGDLFGIKQNYRSLCRDYNSWRKAL